MLEKAAEDKPTAEDLITNLDPADQGGWLKDYIGVGTDSRNLDTLLAGSLGMGAVGGGVSGLLASQVEKERETKEDRRRRIMRQAALGTGLGASVGAIPGGWGLLTDDENQWSKSEFDKLMERINGKVGVNDPKEVAGTTFNDPSGGSSWWPWHGLKYSGLDPRSWLDTSHPAQDYGGAASIAGGGLATLPWLRGFNPAWGNFRNAQLGQMVSSLNSNINLAGGGKGIDLSGLFDNSSNYGRNLKSITNNIRRFSKPTLGAGRATTPSAISTALTTNNTNLFRQYVQMASGQGITPSVNGFRGMLRNLGLNTFEIDRAVTSAQHPGGDPVGTARGGGAGQAFRWFKDKFINANRGHALPGRGALGGTQRWGAGTGNWLKTFGPKTVTSTALAMAPQMATRWAEGNKIEQWNLMAQLWKTTHEQGTEGLEAMTAKYGEKAVADARRQLTYNKPLRAEIKRLVEAGKFD